MIVRPPWLAAARRVARACGEAAAALVFHVVRVRRAHVEGALARASLPAGKSHVWAVYRTLGASLGEWLLARVVDPRHIDALVSWTPRAERAWEEARARGPVVVCATHTGNWELALASLARRAPTTAIVRRITSPLARAVVRGARARFGVDVLEAGATHAAAARGALRDRVLVSVVDQRPDAVRARHVVPLLGAPAALDAAPFVIAARARATVLLAVAARGAHGRTEVDVLASYAPPRRASVRWVDASLASAARSLDAFVRAHPDQWLWLHRLWPRTTAARAPREAHACPAVLAPLGDGHGR